jgi:ADP-heptose:LPS heptosyltransferase
LEAVRAKILATLGDQVLPKILLLNANCSDMIPLRRWSSDRFVELARRFLQTNPEAAVIFTGAPIEQVQADELAHSVGSKRCVSMAGRTSLPELFALYSLSTVLVTNDSGPAHFASLTPVKIVALFGPETPALFGPLSKGSLAISAGLPCSPCVSAQNNRLSACRNNLCMQAISVDRVFAEVTNLTR